MTGDAGGPFHDEIAEFCLEILLRSQALPRRRFTPDWGAFSRLSRTVHDGFEIPSTTFSPVMRHLLYLLASYRAPRAIVGAGTFVGYTFAWLIRDGEDCPPGQAPREMVGLDIDPDAAAIARRNCSVLNHGDRLEFRVEDAVAYLRRRIEPIDCLYIDVDAPDGRKQIYVDILESALATLGSGALVLAHDPCLEMFAAAFEAYHALVERHPRLRGPWILPADACGLSVAVAE